MARKQAPWLYKAAKLEGDVHMVRALAFRDRGDNDNADKNFALAVSRYEEAAAIGHSDHEVHEALAEAWIRQEEMDLYRGVDPRPRWRAPLTAADHAIEAAPKESYGHTKKSLAYLFVAQYQFKQNSFDASISNHNKQLLESKLATELHTHDALSHDLKGTALRQISFIKQAMNQPFLETIRQSYNSYESALIINPKFPWAIADYADHFPQKLHIW